MIAAGLAVAAPAAALAGAFPAEIELSTLDGTNGFALDGTLARGDSGHSVSAAGDINGDGFGDIIVGAPLDAYNSSRPGMGYVVFGTDQGFPAQSSLSTLDGINGFAIAGIADGDQTGNAVSGAGDVNNDGFDDIVIEATYADANGVVDAGRRYVVFGAAQGFPAVFELSTLDGTNGFVLNGINRGDAGWAVANVSGAGDINGDGFGDIVIGAHLANRSDFIEDPLYPGSEPGRRAGQSYLVFGAAQGFPAEINLSALDGTNGFTIDGVNAYDESGMSVSAAGDVNADGFDDFIIGANFASYNGVRPGQSYVVFGTGQGFPAVFDLATLDGTNGFALSGIESGDGAGYSVSDAGDVNGDGIADIVIGAPYSGTDPAVISSRSYVVFGRSGGFPAQFELSSLDGTNGFTLIASEIDTLFGISVSGAGDVNGDGIADVVIGEAFADIDGRVDSGRSYVVFGSDQGFPALLQISMLDGTNGFALNGISENGWAGYSVSDAGDVNGDGIGDIIIGAFRSLSADNLLTGQTYVVFGRPAAPAPPPALTVSGACPGTVTIGLTRATPGGAVSLYGAIAEGTFVIPSGSCTGAVLDLDSPEHIVTGLADANGAAQIVVRLPPPACGKFLQVIDEATCTTSNIAQLP